MAKTPLSDVCISVSEHLIEGAVFSKKDLRIIKSVSMQLPHRLLFSSGDQISDVEQLAGYITAILKELGTKSRRVHLSVPAALLKVVEMPNISDKELSLALSSEAERYKAFDGTDALVAFTSIESNQPGKQVITGAIRKDTFEKYIQAFKLAKVQPVTVDFEMMNLLRGLAGSGLLDSLVEQVGPQAYWGVIFVESERIRLSLWQANNFVSLREVQISADSMSTVQGENLQQSVVVQDLLEEIRRTTQTEQPSIWLTYRLPGAVGQVLAEMTGVPFHPCILPPNFPIDQPNLMIPTIGAAMRSYVPFPFDMDLMSGAGGAKSQTGMTVKEEGPIDPRIKLAFGGSIVLVLLAWMGTFAGTFFINGQITERQQQISNTQGEISRLKSEIQTMGDKMSLQSLLSNTANEVRRKNAVYISFAEDLRDKTPQNLWIENIDLDSSIRVTGKSFHHQSILNFAQGFDEVPYAQQIVIRFIREGKVEEQPIYNFELTGNTQASDELVKKYYPDELGLDEDIPSDPAVAAPNTVPGNPPSASPATPAPPSQPVPGGLN